MDMKKFLGMDEEDFNEAMEALKKVTDNVRGSLELTEKMKEMLNGQEVTAILTALQYNTIKTIFEMTDDEEGALALSARFNKMLVSGIEHMYDAQEDDDDEETLEEAVQLQKVSVTHGDNGQQTKSTVAANSGAKGMASKPVSMGNGAESVPNGPKGPSNAYSKGETQVKGATSWKNAPAQAGQDLEKAPAPKHGDNGQNTKSVIEGRQTTKKRI